LLMRILIRRLRNLKISSGRSTSTYCVRTRRLIHLRTCSSASWRNSRPRTNRNDFSVHPLHSLRLCGSLLSRPNKTAETQRAQRRRRGRERTMKRIVAQIRKELTQFSRDKLTVTLALVLPLIIMWLLGCAVSLTVTDLPVVVQDWDQTITSRRYFDTIKSSLTFRVVELGLNESPE